MEILGYYFMDGGGFLFSYASSGIHFAFHFQKRDHRFSNMITVRVQIKDKNDHTLLC